MFNIGIIGLGDNGTMHLRGFSRLKETRVAAVCDTSAKARDRAMAILNDDSVLSTSSYEKLCEMKELDAVAVCVPTYFHLPCAILAMNSGKDVFLEKPIAPTLKDTDIVIEQAFETGRIVQVGLVYRYSNLYRTLGKMVDGGSFGNVMMAYCKEFRDNFPTQWFFETEKSGGALLDKDCHHFDLFSWFIKSRPETVYAMGGQHVVKGKKIKVNCAYAPDKDLMIKNPDIIDHAFVTVRYENGALGNLGLCMYQVEPNDGLEIGVIGNNGAHALAKKDVILTAGGGPLGEVREIPVDYESDNHGIGHIGADMQHVEFVECMKNRAMPFANLLLARESMTICLAAETSIKEGREVRLEEFDNPAVTKLLKKHAKEVYRETPDPLPAPAARKKEKGVPREKEIVDAFVDFVRLLMGKRPKSEALPFSKEVFAEAMKKISGNAKFAKLSKGLNAGIGFEYPGKTAIYVTVSDGKAELLSGGRRPDETKIIFTEEGWKSLQTGDSIQKLLLTRQVRVEGKVEHLKPYTEAFVVLSKALSSGG